MSRQQSGSKPNVQEWIITQDTIRIGRGDKNEMRLSEAIQVSQDHCRISNVAGKLQLLNMCANTWLDGVRMETGVSAEINEHNNVWIGREAFCFMPVDARQFVIRRMIKDSAATVHFRAPKRRCFEEDDATKRSRTEIVDVVRETEPMLSQVFFENPNRRRQTNEDVVKFFN